MPDSVTKDSPVEIQYPPSILEDVTKLVQRVQTFTGATGAAIALREGEDMVCRGSRGSNAPDVGMVLSTDGTFTGLAVTGMKAVRCDDTENDPRVDPEISRSLRIKSMAVVPVLSGMRVSGVIATFSSMGNAFSDTHMAVLKTMADGLGANIQRWMDGQGGSSAAAFTAPPKPQVVPPQPRVEAPRPPAPKIEPLKPVPAPVAQVEAPKPAPKVEPTPAKAPASAAAAVAPAVEKLPEPPATPKKPEQKPQGKWKPVTLPKQDDEDGDVKPAAKTEPKAQPKSEPAPRPKAEPVYGPAFSYAAKSSEPESNNMPIVIGGIVMAIMLVALGGYFMFGRGKVKPPSTAPVATQQAQQTAPESAPTATAPTATTTAPTPATTNNSKPEAPKSSATQTAATGKPGPVLDTTKIVSRTAPLIVAPTPSSGQESPDAAPPSISMAANAGPALNIPATTAAPRLSAPPPANAVIVPSRLIQRVNPAYPTAAKQYRIEGAVTLSATIGSDGRVKNAQIISGPPMLRDAAVGAVKQWKYAPSTVNGRAVESSVQVVLQFKMPN
jgi:TonB family protein